MNRPPTQESASAVAEAAGPLSPLTDLTTSSQNLCGPDGCVLPVPPHDDTSTKSKTGDPTT